MCSFVLLPGVAHLHGYRVCDATDEANVSIVLNPPLPKMRRFVLKADSASEAVRCVVVAVAMVH